MKRNVLAMAALVLAATCAVAQGQMQQNPPAQSGPGNPAIDTSRGNTSNNPVSGANSFTEGQAKSHIESRGYSSVTQLRKDENGVWRGKAMKDGKSVDVSLDFQGNVIAR
jgi:opacity protein-like surface antigen